MTKTRLCKALEELQDAMAVVMQERHDLLEALDKIASWNEGKEVDGSFDEPYSARQARAAIAKVKHSSPQ